MQLIHMALRFKSAICFAKRLLVCINSENSHCCKTKLARDKKFKKLNMYDPRKKIFETKISF